MHLSRLIFTFSTFSVLYFWNCGSTEGEQAQPAPETDQIRTPEVRVVEIPEARLTATQAPVPFPYHPRGLSFQVGQAHTPYRPLGDAVFAKDGSVWTSIAERDILMVFSVPSYDIRIMGPQKMGGQGLPLHRPGPLSAVGDQVVVSSLDSGAVYVLDAAGEVADYVDLGSIHGVRAGPQGEFLAQFPEQQAFLQRLDSQGRVLTAYPFGPDPSRGLPLDIERYRGPVHITPEWDVIFVNSLASELYHFKKSAQVIIHMSLDFSKTGDGDLRAPSALDLTFQDDRYWLLLGTAEKTAFLAAFDAKGRLHSFFRLPKYFDLMDLHDRTLLLGNRTQGSLQTFPL